MFCLRVILEVHNLRSVSSFSTENIINGFGKERGVLIAEGTDGGRNRRFIQRSKVREEKRMNTM